MNPYRYNSYSFADIRKGFYIGSEKDSRAELLKVITKRRKKKR